MKKLIAALIIALTLPAFAQDEDPPIPILPGVTFLNPNGQLALVVEFIQDLECKVTLYRARTISAYNPDTKEEANLKIFELVETNTYIADIYPPILADTRIYGLGTNLKLKAEAVGEAVTQ